jgi:hypothetical protein
MIRLVADAGDRLLQPGYGAIVIALLNEVGADVVVGITECRIDVDCQFAFGYCRIKIALKPVGPAQKSMSFGGGKNLDRILV